MAVVMLGTTVRFGKVRSKASFFAPGPYQVTNMNMQPNAAHAAHAAHADLSMLALQGCYDYPDGPPSNADSNLLLGIEDVP